MLSKGGVFGNALQGAVAEDELDIAELLLARGANVDPPDLEWKQLVERVGKEIGNKEADRLRKFQENPTGYIESRRRLLEEEEADRRRNHRREEVLSDLFVLDP